MLNELRDGGEARSLETVLTLPENETEEFSVFYSVGFFNSITTLQKTSIIYKYCVYLRQRTG